MPAMYSIGYARMCASVYAGRSWPTISATCWFIESLSHRGTETQRNLFSFFQAGQFSLFLALCLCVSVASLSISVQARSDHLRGRCPGAGGATDCRRERLRDIADRENVRHACFLVSIYADVTALVYLQLLAKQFRAGLNTDPYENSADSHLKRFESIFAQDLNRFDSLVAQNPLHHRLGEYRNAMCAMQSFFEFRSRSQSLTPTDQRHRRTNLGKQQRIFRCRVTAPDDADVSARKQIPIARG